MANYGGSHAIGQGYYRAAINIWKVSETETSYTFKVEIWGELKNINGWDPSYMWLGQDWNGSSYSWSQKASGNMYCAWHSDWYWTNFDKTYEITKTKTTNAQTLWYACSIKCGSGAESWAEMSVTIPAEGTPPTITQSQSARSATQINISGTSNVDCKQWCYQVDSGSWVYWTGSARSASNIATVSEGVHTIQISGQKTSNNVWGYGTKATVDTTLPRLQVTVGEPTTDSFSFTATADYDCNSWEYSFDNGSTWVTFSTANAQTASAIVTGLTVNTTYNLIVRARRTENNLYSPNITQQVKTQGGIVHVDVNRQWKDAIAYVKIGSAWKQTICYTKVGSSWRINT